MHYKHAKNKKYRFFQGRKVLFSAVAMALGTFPFYQAHAANIFADTLCIYRIQ